MKILYTDSIQYFHCTGETVCRGGGRGKFAQNCNSIKLGAEFRQILTLEMNLRYRFNLFAARAGWPLYGEHHERQKGSRLCNWQLLHLGGRPRRCCSLESKQKRLSHSLISSSKECGGNKHSRQDIIQSGSIFATPLCLRMGLCGVVRATGEGGEKRRRRRELENR